MTSAHSMFLPKRGRLRLRALAITVAAISIALPAGCQRERLEHPINLSAPYDRAHMWAIAPFTNESGVSVVRSDRIADAFAEQVESVDGISIVPVNRVLFAMRRLNMQSVATPADAYALMNVLGVDGLIVGTVTAYDPYPPPKFGAAVQLWRRESSAAVDVDPTRLTRSATDRINPAALAQNQPAAQASGIFDAANHQVLMWLDDYATGRTEPGSAFGKRAYLVNMEMYTQFVAYRLLHDLLMVERITLQTNATQQE